MMNFPEYVGIRIKYFGENITEAYYSYQRYVTHCMERERSDLERIRGMEFDWIIIDEVIEEEMNVTYENMWASQSGPICTFPQCKPAECAPAPVPKFKPAFKKGLCVPTQGCPTQKEEVENTMTTNTEREYLLQRVRNVFAEKREEFVKKYNLYNDNTPKTYKELIDAIKNGQFELDTKRTARIDLAAEEKEYYNFRGPFDGIKWTIPGGPDQKGYELAIDALIKARTAAMDVIATGDAATVGLKALKDFESWTYTASAA